MTATSIFGIFRETEERRRVHVIVRLAATEGRKGMKSRRVDLRFLDDTEEEGDKEGWQQGQSSAVGRQGQCTITLRIRH